MPGSGQITLATIGVFAGFSLCTSIRAQQLPELSGVIEEIVVTARRIEENFQEVPMSVAAFSADDLELRGIQRVEDLSVMVPNLQITGQSVFGESRGRFTIRGLPGVRRYMDGAWIPWGTGSITQQIVEIDRIEILRGPQGTLFGRDATGGAIQIITKKPVDEFGANATLTLGNYDRRDLVAVLDAPLSDTVKTRWTVASLERDGYIDSVTIDRSYGSIDNETFRGDMLWTPNNRFSLRAVAEIDEYRSNGHARIMAAIRELPSQPFPLAQAYTLVGLPFTNQTHTAGWSDGEVGQLQTKNNYTRPGMDIDSSRLVLDMDWVITEQLSLKWISAFNEQEEVNFRQSCACEFDLSSSLNLAERDIRSHEIQLHGEHERVRWVAGLYYSDGGTTNRDINWTFQEFRDDPGLLAAIRQIIPPFGLPPMNNGTGGSFENTTKALFGDATIRLTDMLSLSVGLRWFEQEGSTTRGAFLSPLGSNVGELPADPLFAFNPVQVIPREFDHTTPRISLQYEWNDNVMGYASYAEGFNSGGTNLPLQNSTELIDFEPETIETFEIGLRSDWWDNRLRLNATLFRTDWVDIQVSELIFGPTGFLGALTTNAGGAEAEGIEIELAIAPSENWRFDIGIGLLDTRYTEVGAANNITLDTPFDSAPESSWTIGVQNNLPLANGGRLISRLDYGWLDDYVRARGTNTLIFEPGYGLLNARVSYLAGDGSYRLSLFGTNLTDEYYLNSGFIGGFGVQLATAGRPREWGMSLQYFFD